MDAHEDYVWPRATSELILLPVTGLECVGERLLAGEFWLRRALAEKKLNARLGSGLKNKGMPRGGGRAAGGSPEMAGLKRGPRSPGNKKLRWLPRPFINCR